jgi:hypothetical protein
LAQASITFAPGGTAFASDSFRIGLPSDSGLPPAARALEENVIPRKKDTNKVGRLISFIGVMAGCLLLGHEFDLTER